jgi:hypothetical protein
MASQEQLILAQLGAESADIFKEEVDTGSGFVQDLQAGVMAAKAFDESVYALQGKLGISEKGFESDYMSGKFKQDSLLGKVGRKMFGMSDISQADTGITSENEDVAGNLSLEKIENEYNLEDLVNDFESSTKNVELNTRGEIITVPFDVKKEIINPAMKPDNSRNTSFVGPVGMVLDSELEDIYGGKPSEGFKYGGVKESSLIPNEEGNVTQDIFAYNVNAPGDTTFARYRGQSPNLAVAGNKAFQNFQQGNYTEVSAEEYRGDNNANKF